MLTFAVNFILFWADSKFFFIDLGFLKSEIFFVIFVMIQSLAFVNKVPQCWHFTSLKNFYHWQPNKQVSVYFMLGARIWFTGTFLYLIDLWLIDLILFLITKCPDKCFIWIKTSFRSSRGDRSWSRRSASGTLEEEVCPQNILQRRRWRVLLNKVCVCVGAGF